MKVNEARVNADKHSQDKDESSYRPTSSLTSFKHTVQTSALESDDAGISL